MAQPIEEPYLVIAIWRRPTGGFYGFCRRIVLATRSRREAERQLAERYPADHLHVYALDANGRPYLRRAP